MKSDSVWVQYQVVWLSALISAGIPTFLWVLKRLARRNIPLGGPPRAREPEAAVTRIYSRYLSQAICISALALLVLVFFPVILSMGESTGVSAATFFSSLVIFLGAFFLGILVLFLKRKGNLDWETDEDITSHEP